MIARTTIAFIREKKENGKIEIYISEKREQLLSELLVQGVEQITTLDELKAAREIRDGTFNEAEII